MHCSLSLSLYYSLRQLFAKQLNGGNKAVAFVISDQILNCNGIAGFPDRVKVLVFTGYGFRSISETDAGFAHSQIIMKSFGPEDIRPPAHTVLVNFTSVRDGESTYNRKEMTCKNNASILNVRIKN